MLVAESASSKALASRVLRTLILLSPLLFLAWQISPLSNLDNTVLVPHRDAGAFLTVAQGLLDGQLPYVELWDHKGPFVYLINAAGIALSRALGDPHQLLGIWLIETTLLLVTWGWFSSILLRQSFSWMAVVCLLWGGAWSLYLLSDGGNRVELFALPIQLISIFVLLRASSLPSSHAENGIIPLKRAGLLLGIALGIGFFLRPNVAVTPLVVAFALILKEQKQSSFSVILRTFTIGALAISLPIGIWLYCLEILPEFWDAYIRYNLWARVGADGGWGSLTPALQNGVRGSAPLMSVAAVIALSLGWTTAFSKEKQRPLRRAFSEAQFLLVSLTVIFLAEIFSSGLTGEGYPHYFISWILPLTTLLVVLSTSLLAVPASTNHTGYKRTIGSLLLYFTALASPISIALTSKLSPRIEPTSNSMLTALRAQLTTAAEHTDSPELFIWGAEPGVSFILHAPTMLPFFYLYPLLDPTTAESFAGQAFIQKLMETRPVILESALDNRKIPPLFQTPLTSIYSQELADLAAFISAEYRPIINETVVISGRRMRVLQPK